MRALLARTGEPMAREIQRTALAVITCAASVNACFASAEKWQFELVPFLWSAGMQGHESVQGMPAQLSTSINDLVHLVDVGAATRFTARRAPVTWYAEGNYVRLDGEDTSPLGPVQTRSDETF